MQEVITKIELNTALNRYWLVIKLEAPFSQEVRVLITAAEAQQLNKDCQITIENI